MSPSAPAPPFPSSTSFSIRPRRSTDIPALAPLLAAVHANDTYPVEGPSPPASFLTPANELVSFVAVRSSQTSFGDDAEVQATGGKTGAERGKNWEETGEEIIGHALLSSLSTSSNLHKAFVKHTQPSSPGPPSGSSRPAPTPSPVLAAAQSSVEAASLGRLFTHPSSRGLGAGRALIDTALEWVRERGMRVLLNVIEKDVRAIELYGRMGWENIGKGVYRMSSGEEWGEVYFLAPP